MSAEVSLRLTDEQARVLGDVLAIYASNLRAEIEHTDSPTFRRDLRERLHRLNEVSEQLASLPERLPT